MWIEDENHGFVTAGYRNYLSHAEIGRFFDQSMEMRPFQKKGCSMSDLKFSKRLQREASSSEGQQLSNFSYHIMFHRQALGSPLVSHVGCTKSPKRKDMQISCKHWGFKPTCSINLIEILGTTSHLFTKIRRLTRAFHPMLEVWSQHRFGYLDAVPIEVQEVCMAEKWNCSCPHAGFEVRLLVETSIAKEHRSIQRQH